MRKYLGVVAVVAGLCMILRAQTAPPAPATTQAPVPPPSTGPEPATIPTPPTRKTPPTPYPRFELFAGGSYAEASLFNAGHWAGLPGWDASLGLNATHWLGFVVEGGQYFGTSKIPITAPEPFPPCTGTCQPPPGPTFDVTTREFNFLFGAQFSRRKYELWTPFGEILYGHNGTRGVADLPGFAATEVGSGRALVAGGGLDRKINQRFALRFKADYFQTASQFPTFAKKKQDNFRFSVGIVIRSVPRKKRKLEDETQPEP